MMIFLDPPRHDRLRKLVSRAFTPRRLAGLEVFIRATVTRLIDRLLEQGGGDFVRELSMPLPMDVIFTLLGVPESAPHWLRERMWSCRSSASATRRSSRSARSSPWPR